MRTKALKSLDVRSTEQWRQWLAEHHESEAEVWLVFHKRHTGQPSIEYGEAVDEALCFGWVDSLIKRLDEDRYARKFTPRKPDSKWSTVNRQRYARLKAAGRLMPAGLSRAPTERNGDAPAFTEVPSYIQQALRQRPAAKKYFESLAPSYRRKYLIWIDSAKLHETKMKRLREALDLLEAGQKPGLK